MWILRKVFYWVPFAVLSAVKWIGLAVGMIIKVLISPLLWLYRKTYDRVESGYHNLLPGCWIIA